MNEKKQQNGRKKIDDINQTSLTMHKKNTNLFESINLMFAMIFGTI